MFTEDVHFLIAALSVLYTLIEVAAIFTAIRAVRDTRTPQGAIAWSISLITFPVMTLPLYWIFGRSKFHGYVDAMREGEARFKKLIGDKHNVPTIKAVSERRRPLSSDSL